MRPELFWPGGRIVLETLTISTSGKDIKKLYLGSLQLFRAGDQEMMDINYNSRGID